MKTLVIGSVALAAALVSGSVIAEEPKHRGKCGGLQELNAGSKLDNCKVGDVILVQRKIVPMYCDYRYQVVPFDGKGANAKFTCIMRVTRKDKGK